MGGRKFWTATLGAAFAAALLLVVSAAQAKPGGLDPSFGHGGKVTTKLVQGSRDEEIDRMTLQPDGKILAAGYSWNGSQDDYALARYNPNGKLDPSFGKGGKVVIAYPKEEWYDGVAVQPDGKIVAVGRATLGVTPAFGITRFRKNGSLDTSFGSGGQVVLMLGDAACEANEVVIQPDGKIVVAGYTSDSGGYGFMLIRLTSRGALDTSFGTHGVVKTFFGPAGSAADGSASDLALQPDGKIVAVGYGRMGADAYGFAAARYKPNGALDTSFGSGGKATVSVGDEDTSYAYRVALQPDGKILVAGRAYNTDTSADMAAIRLTPAGKLDPSFGHGGKLIGPFGTGYDSAEAVLVQRNGKIVLVGYARDSSNTERYAAARYTRNGRLDPTFGSHGKALTGVHGHDDYALDGVLQPDGGIVAGGTADLSNDYSDYVFSLIRYQGDTCKIPKLKGKKLRAAKKLLRRATCGVGKVKKRSSSKIKRGRVLSTKPGAGTKVASTTPVDLVVSKGRKHQH